MKGNRKWPTLNGAIIHALITVEDWEKDIWHRINRK